MNKKTLILNDRQIKHKIKRIAFQILEFYDGKEELILAGIAKNGFVFAEKLAEEIENVSDVKPLICEIKIDKKQPAVKPKISLDKTNYQGQNMILVDDVLNTGATLIYTVKHLLEADFKALKTAILIDRSHKRFPIKADFKGISLSTSLNETIKVTFGKTCKAEVF